VPWFIGLAAMAVALSLSYWLIVPRVDALIPASWNDTVVVPLRFLISISFLLLFFLISGGLYLLLVSLFSSTMWEKLSFEVERNETGREISHQFRTSQLLGDGLARGCCALVVFFASLCCGSVLFGIPAIVFAGFLGLLDYTAAAFSRRGVLFFRQVGLIGDLPHRFSFLILSGLLTLIPLVNVLMLPALVAGGTLMVAESETLRRWSPSHTTAD
jgi:uncharacterized protein involved in cysteine biosynthesis